MANEITKRIVLSLANGADRQTSDRGIKTSTQATARPGTLLASFSQDVSADAALTIPGVTGSTQGECLLENLDADPTKYITFGPVVAGAVQPCLRISGGRQASFEMVPSVTYRVLSSSGTQTLQCLVFAR